MTVWRGLDDWWGNAWEPTLELRWFDKTDKLTSPVLQQRWRRLKQTNYGTTLQAEYEYEWRDVPLVWGDQ